MMNGYECVETVLSENGGRLLDIFSGLVPGRGKLGAVDTSQVIGYSNWKFEGIKSEVSERRSNPVDAVGRERSRVRDRARVRVSPFKETERDKNRLFLCKDGVVV